MQKEIKRRKECEKAGYRYMYIQDSAVVDKEENQYTPADVIKFCT